MTTKTSSDLHIEYGATSLIIQGFQVYLFESRPGLLTHIRPNYDIKPVLVYVLLGLEYNIIVMKLIERLESNNVVTKGVRNPSTVPFNQ